MVENQGGEISYIQCLANRSYRGKEKRVEGGNNKENRIKFLRAEEKYDFRL
jgi:hypothetical protein